MSSSYLQTEKRFLLLLEQYRQLLTEADIHEIESFVEARELGVAFELFCYRIDKRGGEHGYATVVSPEQLAEVTAIGNAMALDPNSWDFLEPNSPDA